MLWYHLSQQLNVKQLKNINSQEEMSATDAEYVNVCMLAHCWLGMSEWQANRLISVGLYDYH